MSEVTMSSARDYLEGFVLMNQLEQNQGSDTEAYIKEG
jgi:hypothetical protein